MWNYQIWKLIAIALIFFMQAGFAMCEAGFTRAKNTGNITMKNLMDFCLGTITFILIGGPILCAENALAGGLFGEVGQVYKGMFGEGANWVGWTDFIFNLVFCATTATIVSGAMAERTNFKAYCIYSMIISAVVYPVEAYWNWGVGNNGWLQQLAASWGLLDGGTAQGFIDLSGSCSIHMVGGLTALIGAWMVGPRIGKYVKDENGKVVWSQAAYAFLDKKAPDTANPSLWRNAQLNHYYGLFKVKDDIYQVRGYDMSNITFVKGKTGWIIFDPLMTVECSKAAKQLVDEHLGVFPVKAIIYSHSHIDHYGGVRGILDMEDPEQFIKENGISIIAPEGFEENAVSENVYAGTAMGRRAAYQYGVLLDPGEKGRLSIGIAFLIFLVFPIVFLQKTLSFCILVQILCDTCNSILYVLNF